MGLLARVRMATRVLETGSENGGRAGARRTVEVIGRSFFEADLLSRREGCVKEN